MATDAEANVRAICLGLREVTERLSHGQPTWFVRDKRSFAMYLKNHHGARRALWCAARQGAQEGLIASDSETFFRPPYVGTRGWVGVYLDGEVDWDELSGLLTDAHEVIAAKKR